MRIQHNIAAMNSYRNYSANNSAVAKNLEKLSSGFRINRAGDDAAGLAISEKMRAQITGLETAQKNAKDGISLVQTAEGALTEVHDMLNRMVELSEQSANGTFDNPVDRANLQKEISSLSTEINRIADSVNFNGLNLLDGSLSSTSAAKEFDLSTVSGTFGGQAVDVTGATNGSFATGAGTAATGAGKADVVVNYVDANGETKSVTIKDVAFAIGKGNDAIADAINGNAELSALFTATADSTNGATGAATIEANEAGTSASAGVAGKPMITGVSLANNTATGLAVAGGTGTDGEGAKVDLSGTPQAGDSVTIGDVTYKFKADADGSDGRTFSDLDTLAAAAKQNGITLDIGTDSAVTATKGGQALSLQIGDTADGFNQLKVEIKDMHTAAMGIGDIDISTQASAKNAMDHIKKAINYVSDVRGDLGATQNRLEHTINNLSVMTENIQDAESTIRDVDVAEEMMAYTKNNILVQSAQAMLAQANQLPQGVLQLLQ